MYSLSSSVYFFYSTRPEFGMHLITFKSILVIFYDLFSLNIQDDMRYFHNKS